MYPNHHLPPPAPPPPPPPHARSGPRSHPRNSAVNQTGAASSHYRVVEQVAYAQPVQVPQPVYYNPEQPQRFHPHQQVVNQGQIGQPFYGHHAQPQRATHSPNAKVRRGPAIQNSDCHLVNPNETLLVSSSSVSNFVFF